MRAPALPSKLNLSPNEAAAAGRAVEALLESEGWAILTQALDRQCELEQEALIMSTPGTVSLEEHERGAGRVTGMANVDRIARGIVQAGDQARKQMTEAAEAAER